MSGITQKKYMIKWTTHKSHMRAYIKELLDDNYLTDVTLICDGQTRKAHKLILASSSPYFEAVFLNDPSKHPIVLLRDVPLKHLEYILEFIYSGQIDVPEDMLRALLKSAASLEVVGLSKTELAPQLQHLKIWEEIQ